MDCSDPVQKSGKYQRAAQDPHLGNETKDSTSCYHCDYGLKKKLLLENMHIKCHGVRKIFCNILLYSSTASNSKRFWMLHWWSKGKNSLMLLCMSIFFSLYNCSFNYNCVTAVGLFSQAALGWTDLYKDCKVALKRDTSELHSRCRHCCVVDSSLS